MKTKTTPAPRIFTLRDAIAEKAQLMAILESGDIGELCRNGRPVYYANLSPLSEGRTVEGKTRAEVARKLLEHANRPA